MHNQAGPWIFFLGPLREMLVKTQLSYINEVMVLASLPSTELEHTPVCRNRIGRVLAVVHMCRDERTRCAKNHHLKTLHTVLSSAARPCIRSGRIRGSHQQPSAPTGRRGARTQAGMVYRSRRLAPAAPRAAESSAARLRPPLLRRTPMSPAPRGSPAAGLSY